MAYSRTFYGTGYYIYHQFVDGTPLSRPIESWDGATPPASDVLELVGRAGSDIAPAAGSRRRRGREAASSTCRRGRSDGGVAQRRRSADDPRARAVGAGETQALAFSNARLRVTWDDRARALDRRAGRALLRRRHPLQPRRSRVPGQGVPQRHPVPGRPRPPAVLLPDAVLPRRDDRAGRRQPTTIDDVRFAVRHAPFTDPPNHVGYFHATYRDHPAPEIGQDLVLLDTAKTEGGGDWSGSFVGTTYTFTHDAVLNTLEGDPALLLRRQPNAAGAGHRERGVGRRRRLLGRAHHDAAVRRASGRRAARPSRPRTPSIASTRRTASCSPT